MSKWRGRKKRELRINKIFFLILFLILNSLFLTLSPTTRAASARLQLSPGSITTATGQTFTLQVRISTDTAVNAASASVVFPGSLLEAISTSKAGSIFSFWTTEPTIQGESVVFGGGLPSPGYSGSAGRIITITFRAKAAGTANIIISDSKILANDGGGTNIYSGYNGTVVTINQSLSGAVISSSTHPDQTKWYAVNDVSLEWTRPTGAQNYRYSLERDDNSSAPQTGQTGSNTILFLDLPDGKWTLTLTTLFSGQERVTKFVISIDTAPPKPFTVKLESRLGKYDPSPKFSFTAKDETSGIDHYQISLNGGKEIRTVEGFHTFENLNLGKHQLIIKAYDKAGNFTEVKHNFEIVEIPTAGPIGGVINLFGITLPLTTVASILLILVALLALIAIILERKLIKSGKSWKQKLSTLKEEVDKDIVILEEQIIDDLGLTNQTKKLQRKVGLEISRAKEHIDDDFDRSIKSN